MALRENEGTNRLTGTIIGAAITVHRKLGPGLLEATYEKCLALELEHQGLKAERQVPVPIVYRNTRIVSSYRIDILVEHEVVVELKVVDRLINVHTSQVLTYLRLAGLRVGLLFNFNVDAMVAGGFKRVLR